MNVPLRVWISALVVLSMAIILAVAFTTNYYVVKEELEREARTESLSDAYLLSSLTEDVFVSMRETLKAHHRIVTENWEDQDEIQSIVKMVHAGHPEFNSITIIGSDGVGYANFPNDLDLIGRKVDTEGARQGLELKRDFISDPFVTVDGSLVVIISTALYQDGVYYGMMNGLIRLKEFNFISNFIDQGYTEASSHIAMYDRGGTFIYHPDKELIGTAVSEQAGFEKFDDRKSGVGSWTAGDGEDYIVGFSHVPITDWKVLSLVSKDHLVQPAKESAKRAITFSFPFISLSLLFTMYLIFFITRPLNSLATIDPRLPGPEIEARVKKIRASYREMKNVKRMILSFIRGQQELIGELETFAITDPMTGLANRRRFNQLIKAVEQKQEPFGYLALDIDNFKRVNDTYGHTVGDEVLIRLSELLKQTLPHNAIAIRLGGEEFGVLIHNTSERYTFELAEQIQREVEETVFPLPDSLTISIGAGYMDCERYEVSVFLDIVDQHLYKAKQEGKNRVEMISLQDEDNDLIVFDSESDLDLLR